MDRDILEDEKLDSYEKALYQDLRYSSCDRHDLLAKELFNYRTRKLMITAPEGVVMSKLDEYPSQNVELSVTKKLKCDLFLIVGYPHQSECFNTIDVPDTLKEAAAVMNKAGWRKCGQGSQFGYFCPRHANMNQFYQDQG